MKKNFVITKTPLRVSFLGGGTDIPYFYKKYGGATVNFAINKYVYVTVKRHSRYYVENYRLNYHDSENCIKVNEIKNDIIRETIKYFQIRAPLFISIISDVPAGTGLGGSSAFIVGLVNALSALENKIISKKELFDISTHIELNKIQNPIGKQDHVPAVYGGMLFTRYQKNGQVNIKKIKYGNLNDKLIIVWSNKTRNASEVLNNQKTLLNTNVEKLIKLKKITNNFYSNYFKTNKFQTNQLILALNQSWNLKKGLSDLISFKFANKLINKAIDNKLGAKVLGAGGGGFVLLIDNNKFKKFKLKKKEYTFEKIKVEKSGSEVVYKD